MADEHMVGSNARRRPDAKVPFRAEFRFDNSIRWYYLCTRRTVEDAATYAREALPYTLSQSRSTEARVRVLDVRTLAVVQEFTVA